MMATKCFVALLLLTGTASNAFEIGSLFVIDFVEEEPVSSASGRVQIAQSILKQKSEQIKEDKKTKLEKSEFEIDFTTLNPKLETTGETAFESAPMPSIGSGFGTSSFDSVEQGTTSFFSE